MDWIKEPTREGFYWRKRDAESRANLVDILLLEDELSVLEFGYDMDRRCKLSEWLAWAPDGLFQGPLERPDRGPRDSDAPAAIS